MAFDTDVEVPGPFGAPVPTDVAGATLKKDTLNLFDSTVVAVSSVAPAYTLAATMGALTEAVSFSELITILAVSEDKDVPGILDELEPVARNFYAGSIAAIHFDGDMDSCITLRCVAVAGGKAYWQASAGIVADSDPAAEYDEILHKTGIVRAVLGLPA